MSADILNGNLADWPSQYFLPSELACRCCRQVFVDRAALSQLDGLRRDLMRPLVISSGFRCHRHNRAVNGAMNSFHMKGRAFDILTPTDRDKWTLIGAAINRGFGGIGARYDGFVHIDTGPERFF